MYLSIVIPTYNAEKYISNCLNSVLNQKLTVDQYEILVVNDGSLDKTKDIVSKFTKTYSNLHLISHKTNLGNGAARNTGLYRAKGDYICFIDSDDYIAYYSLHKLLPIALDNSLDVLIYSCKNVKNSNEVLSKNDSINLDNIKIIKGTTFIAQTNYRDEVWQFIVKRTYLKNHEITYYDDRRFSQDMYLTTKILIEANSVTYVPFDLYRYRKTPNSIVNNKSNQHIIQHMYDVLFALKKCYSLRISLISNKETDFLFLSRLYDKQQRYAYIIITRFIQTDLPFSKLLDLIDDFKSMNLYPFKRNPNVENFNYQPKIRLLTYVYNRIILLKSLLYTHRKLSVLHKIVLSL